MRFDFICILHFVAFLLILICLLRVEPLRPDITKFPCKLLLSLAALCTCADNQLPCDWTGSDLVSEQIFGAWTQTPIPNLAFCGGALRTFDRLFGYRQSANLPATHNTPTFRLAFCGGAPWHKVSPFCVTLLALHTGQSAQIETTTTSPVPTHTPIQFLAFCGGASQTSDTSFGYHSQLSSLAKRHRTDLDSNKTNSTHTPAQTLAFCGGLPGIRFRIFNFVHFYHFETLDSAYSF